MPNVLSAAAIYELTVQGIALGQAVLNVMHFTVTATGALDPDIDNEAKLLTNVQGLWRELLSDVSVEYKVTLYRVRSFNSTINNPAHPGSASFLVNYLTETVLDGDGEDEGRSAGDCSPTFNSVGLIKRTSRPGREFRGAMRLPPMPDTAFTDNRVTPDLRDDIQSIVNAWIGPITGGVGTHFTYSMGVFRRTAAVSAIHVLDPATFCRPVIALPVRQLASSQISRKQVKTLGA